MQLARSKQLLTARSCATFTNGFTSVCIMNSTQEIVMLPAGTTVGMAHNHIQTLSEVEASSVNSIFKRETHCLHENEELPPHLLPLFQDSVKNFC